MRVVAGCGAVCQWQDQCMKEEVDSRLAVSRLAVMAFVRITCARAGSAAKDWCAHRDSNPNRNQTGFEQGVNAAGGTAAERCCSGAIRTC